MNAMELHTRVTGDGPPLVLLHGLFGSNENLGGIARALAERFCIHGMDLRNHGRSPHGRPMDYATMARDVAATMDAHGLSSAAVLGHSMGGKVAMELALSAPERVDRLIVVDIAPVAYERQHDSEFRAMQQLDLTRLRTRGEADTALQTDVPNPAIRQFLLKNLIRGEHGFAWRLPLETIANEYDAIAAAPPSAGPYAGPALFIRGGASDYLPEDAEPTIHERFPNARVEAIPDAAHWVHVEAPRAFLERVEPFLSTTDSAPSQ